MGLELYTLLETFFFKLHPEFSKNDFYIFGESYGGKYVPYAAFTILQQNNQTASKINLQGIAIGNGYINPYIQECTNGPFLYAHGLIDDLELEADAATCSLYQVLIDAGLYDEAMYYGNLMFEVLVTEGGIGDVYDIRRDSDPTDPLQDALNDYLNDATVMHHFNASSPWTACSTTPYFALIDDFARSSEVLFPLLLAKLPVLLYNGNFDLICNYFGTTQLMNSLQWTYQNDFISAKNKTWTTGAGARGGTYRTSHGFTQVVVENAGHMSPFDQPANLWDLVYRFINNGFN